MPPREHDPLCGIDIADVENPVTGTFEGRALKFCSEFCKARFFSDTKRFSGEPLMKIRKVKKEFKLGKNKLEILRGVDFNVWTGDFTAIIGASGSGKSTTLNMVGLLDVPTDGEIILKGDDISKLSEIERANLRSKTYGFVFQQYNLIPWLTAYENVTLPLIFSQREIDMDTIDKRFEQIGLKDRVNHRPFELSGGEQQRVAFMRALANDPEIIIGDEPTGNLDSKTGDIILKLLIDLNKQKGKSLIIVTHDADIAAKADLIITMKDGRVVPDHRKHTGTYTE